MNKATYETGAAVRYDFPVSLQPGYTKDGKEIPRLRTVVREDTNQPISYVSSKFTLVPHKEVMDAADSFVKQFGKPKVTFTLRNSGASLLGEYFFQDNTQAVALNDLVGLRVFIENAYNASRSLIIKIGGMRLKCFNGQAIAGSFFEFKQRHTGEVSLEFPDPDDVFNAFKLATTRWKELKQRELSPKDYTLYAEKAVEEHIIQKPVLSNLCREKDQTAWGLYNDFTYHISHESKAKAFGKIARQERVDKWFSKEFLSQTH